jgi:hypothetical protein
MMSAITPGPLDGAGDIDLAESVAGEEDPGASIDMTTKQPSPTAERMSPGDEAPAGTPGTGEDVCPDCGGTGQRAGRECPTCQGTGKVTVGIGGA